MTMKRKRKETAEDEKLNAEEESDMPVHEEFVREKKTKWYRQ